MGSSPLWLLLKPPSLGLSASLYTHSCGCPSITSQNPSFLGPYLGSVSCHPRTRWVGAKRRLQKWSCGDIRRERDKTSCSDHGDGALAFGSDEEIGTQVPTQVQSVVEGSSTVLVSEYKPTPDLDYLQELLAIQQQGPRAIGFFGTRNMGFMHQQLIEILSYAMVITKNHIYTSGASGTNAAVIRGALRAEKPELLTVILPQSLKMQPPESQELLAKVKNLIEKPYNDHLPLIEASSTGITGSAIWTFSRTCSKSYVSRFTTADCLWRHVKKQRI